MKICAVIPAAGLGTRLGLNKPKLLAPITKQMNIWSILREKLIPFVDHIHIISSPAGLPLLQNELHQDISTQFVSISIQPKPIGMGDAVFCGHSTWSKANTVLIVWGDQIFISPETIKKTLETQSNKIKTITVPLARVTNPYVEYIFDANLTLQQIKQSREGDQCHSTGLADVGTFALSTSDLLPEWENYLQLPHHGNLTQEINFLPFLPFLSSRQWHIQTVNVKNTLEVRGINTQSDLDFFRMMYSEILENSP